MISSYAFNGAQEYCLIRGGDADAKICILPPLFDEMNRMRRTLVEVMRLLDARGIGSVLPDLPGCNESLGLLSAVSLSDWKAAVRSACEQKDVTHIASVRGGCLLDDAVPHLPRWRLAETQGSKLLRTMIRTRIASGKEDGVSSSSESLMQTGRAEGLQLAGNMLSADMIAQLENAIPQTGDNIRSLAIGHGEGQISGQALWLRAEPDYDPVLARAIADDIGAWCG